MAESLKNLLKGVHLAALGRRPRGPQLFRHVVCAPAPRTRPDATPLEESGAGSSGPEPGPGVWILEASPQPSISTAESARAGSDPARQDRFRGPLFLTLLHVLPFRLLALPQLPSAGAPGPRVPGEAETEAPSPLWRGVGPGRASGAEVRSLSHHLAGAPWPPPGAASPWGGQAGPLTLPHRRRVPPASASGGPQAVCVCSPHARRSPRCPPRPRAACPARCPEGRGERLGVWGGVCWGREPVSRGREHHRHHHGTNPSFGNCAEVSRRWGWARHVAALTVTESWHPTVPGIC